MEALVIPVDPALVVHLFTTFASDDIVRADAGYQQLRQAWQQLGARLGLDEPAHDAGVPVDPPEQRPTGVHTALLAGRRRPGPQCTMWWNHVHDVACISLVVSQEGSRDRAWQDLYEQWTAASAGLDLSDMLGTAEIYTALTDAPGSVPVDERTAAVLAENLPSTAVSAWQDSAVATTEGLAIYQLSARHDVGPTRRMAVLAPSGADAELGEWVWKAGLGRLSMYLLNGAKLRQQARAIYDARPAVADLRLHSSQQFNQLQPLLTRDREPWAPDRLLAEERSLLSLQARADGLIDTLARVATFRRTIEIAADNMAELSRGHVEPGRATHFDDDQRLARRLGVELDDEYAYLTFASQRAAHFATVAATELSYQQENTTRAEQHRENQFALFQTLILSTILMALTAIQAFGYKVTVVPERTQPAVITILGAIAFLLYAVSLRRADRTQNSDRAHRWSAVLVTVGAGATGATLGWISGTLLPAADRPSVSTGTGALTAVGFVVGAAIAAAALFSRRRAHGRDS